MLTDLSYDWSENAFPSRFRLVKDPMNGTWQARDLPAKRSNSQPAEAAQLPEKAGHRGMAAPGNLPHPNSRFYSRSTSAPSNPSKRGNPSDYRSDWTWSPSSDQSQNSINTSEGDAYPERDLASFYVDAVQNFRLNCSESMDVPKLSPKIVLKRITSSEVLLEHEVQKDDSDTDEVTFSDPDEIKYHPKDTLKTSRQKDIVAMETKTTTFPNSDGIDPATKQEIDQSPRFPQSNKDAVRMPPLPTAFDAIMPQRMKASDGVIVTDVTSGGLTITIKESGHSDGFFGGKSPQD